MVGPMRRHDKQRREAASGKRPQDERELEQRHVTEEQVRHIRNQLPASNRLLEKIPVPVQVAPPIRIGRGRVRAPLRKDTGETPSYTRPPALPILQVLLEFRHEPIAYYR